MSLHRYDKRRDANEPEIIEAAEKCGYTVQRVDDPCDLLIGKHGISHLVEVKLPPGPKGGTSHSSLNPKQTQFRDWWRGCYHVVRTVDDLLEGLRRCPGAREDT